MALSGPLFAILTLALTLTLTLTLSLILALILTLTPTLPSARQLGPKVLVAAELARAAP